MAVNLGVALATTGVEVCVVDLDLAFGDVAITMQLIPEHTITEAADSEEDLDFSLLQKLLTRHAERADDPGRARPTPRAATWITASLARRVIQTLRRHFDFVVIDTPPGFDDQVLGAFDETDECVIVATLDVPTIKNTKVAIETLDLLNLVPQQPAPRAQPRRRGGRPVAGQRRGHPGDEGLGRRCRARPPSRAPPTTASPSSCPSPTTRCPRPSRRSPASSPARPRRREVARTGQAWPVRAPEVAARRTP